MMQLIDPTYAHQERRVMGVDSRHGVTRLQLDFSTISEAVRWFTVDELKAVNPEADFESIIRPFEDLAAMTTILRSSGDWHNARDSYEWKLDHDIETALKEPPPLTVVLTPALAANVNASAGVVIKIVPTVSLFHESMVEEKKIA